MERMKKKAFCLLGPFHSGTNLMARILSRQFSSSQKVHKHTLSEIKIDPDVIYIVMYKNVYNWMASIKKEPYEIRFLGGFYDPIQYQNRYFDHLLALYHEYYQRYRVFLQTYPTQTICIDYYRLIQGMSGLTYLNHQLQTIGSPVLQDQAHFLRMLSTPSKRHGKSVYHYKEALQKRDANHAFYKTTSVNMSLFLMRLIRICMIFLSVTTVKKLKTTR